MSTVMLRLVSIHVIPRWRKLAHDMAEDFEILAHWARRNHVQDRTAQNWAKRGAIPGVGKLGTNYVAWHRPTDPPAVARRRCAAVDPTWLRDPGYAPAYEQLLVPDVSFAPNDNAGPVPQRVWRNCLFCDITQAICFE